MRSIIRSDNTKHVLHGYSKGFFHTIGTLHGSKEHRLRQTVQLIRDNFDSNDIEVRLWLPTEDNLVDLLTKHNNLLQRTFKNVCANGKLTVTNNHIRKLNIAETNRPPTINSSRPGECCTFFQEELYRAQHLTLIAHTNFNFH